MKTDKNSQATTSGAQSQSERAFTDTNPAAAVKHGSVYEQITARICALLQQGVIPWRKPWRVQTGGPRNFVTKKSYRGINVFLLLAAGFESPLWLTFRQAQQLGASVRKGEKACPVVFWKPLDIEDKESGETQKIPLLRFYHVFNVAQCDGLKISSVAEEEPVTGADKPQEVIERMPKRPDIRHGMTRAFYSSQADFVGMPARKRFENGNAYFSTLFHELIHSTGHDKRLNRPTLNAKTGFGANPYCKEELIAEMGAAFLCAQAGIVERTIDNSASYIHGWLEQLHADKTLIVRAAAQAQKAADFILGTPAVHEGGCHE